MLKPTAKKATTVAKKTPAKKAAAVKKPAAKKAAGKEPTPLSAKRKLSNKQVDSVVKEMAVKKPAAKKVAPKKTTAAGKIATAKLTVKGKSPKDVATALGEPYVDIISVELDPTNVGNGAFELDWNEIFLAKLIRAGFQGKTDADIVDNWFKTICRNVLAEEYEQWEANQPMEDRPRVVERRDLGNGRTEVS